MPWLYWNFSKQDWDDAELLVIDSSPVPVEFPADSRVRVLSVQAKTSVPAKRNIALEQARGRVITWFDDDDWQHPRKLTLLHEALSGDVAIAGCTSSWFVDLDTGRCRRHRSNDRVLFNSAGFLRDCFLGIRFDPNVRRASDTRWMSLIRKRVGRERITVLPDTLFFWLSHRSNLSNPSRRGHFPHDRLFLREVVGEPYWDSTERQLADLRSRASLAEAEVETSFAPAARPESASTHDGEGRISDEEISEMTTSHELLRAKQTSKLHGEGNPDEKPQVSVVIKATVLDAPYLATMVPHMIRQARFPFHERIIVVDPRLEFAGKYRRRNAEKRSALDEALETLLGTDEIDRVVEVDDRRDLFMEISERYFGSKVSEPPAYANTGGPIYTTLFGIEAAVTDLVVQMDCDVFFFQEDVSWVVQSLEAMASDDRLWLMMTHPGPPTGNLGRSIDHRNRSRAVWDADLKLWRFQHATTRYFLCDRSRLYGKIPVVTRSTGCLPLEQCISHALRKHGAFRGNLGDLHSWHLHAWSHAPPFPQWADAVARAVEAGLYPPAQAGNYDLRLDRASTRRMWLPVLERFLPEKVKSSTFTKTPKVLHADAPGTETTLNRPGEATPPERARLTPTRAPLNGPTTLSSFPAAVSINSVVHPEPPPPGCCPIAVVLPIRDRAGPRVQRVLWSLTWQTVGPPAQIFVVSHGSQSPIEDELEALCRESGAHLLTFGHPQQAWNKPLALNIGIRAISEAIDYVMVVDADMIFSPDFFGVLLAELDDTPQRLVLCRIFDLPEHTHPPVDRETLLTSYEDLLATTKKRHKHGTGAMQAAPRGFFHNVRGYDEDLLWWGAMDGDLVQRARASDLEIRWIENRTTMLHQWHPRKHLVLTDATQRRQAMVHWRRNHALSRRRLASGMIKRNPRGWGGIPDLE